MKIFVFVLAITAAFAIKAPVTDYLPPVAAGSAPVPSADYLPPISAAASEPGPAVIEAPRPLPDNVAAGSAPQGSLAADGYRYKTVRKLKYRHRRDVSELNKDYLPPFAASEQHSVSVAAPAPEVFSAQASAPVSKAADPIANFVDVSEAQASVPQGTLAQDGYRYKTVRKLKYRHRRDVSELNRDYLPPVAASEQHSVSVSAPVQSFSAQASAPAPVVAPAPVSFSAPAPVADFDTSASVPQGSLAQDGYRYKTVRKLKYRHRRDVSELNRDYLPPVAASEQHSVVAPAPVQSFSAQASAPAPVVAPAPVSFSAPAPVADFDTSASVPQGSLAQDGYRYKTVRKLKYRHRRDVSELNRDYLPPVAASEQHSVVAPALVQSFSAQASAPAPVVAPAPVSFSAPAPVADFDTSASVPQGSLAQDGYRYKTVRKLKYRHRRDVSELNRDYLPPVAASEQHSVVAPAPVQSFSAQASAPAPVVAPAPVSFSAPAPVADFDTSASVPQGSLAQDGYRYKTVRKLKYRHRRDVSELNRDYLPPVAASEQHSVVAPAPVQSFSAQASAPAPVVAPAPVSFSAPAPVADFDTSASVPQGSLAQDGYRYKTVRKLKYRHRRDVSELNRDYLPPVAASEQHSVSIAAPAPVQSFSAQASAPAPVVAPAPVSFSAPAPVADFETSASVSQGSLAQDGYRYKTVRRLRYRHRY